MSEDRIEPPRMLELTLEPQDLRGYAEELEEAARVGEIRVKHAAQAHSETSGGEGVSGVLDSLRRGELLAIQIGYSLQGVSYCDTLLGLRDGAHRLIRRVGEPSPAEG